MTEPEQQSLPTPSQEAKPKSVRRLLKWLLQLSLVILIGVGFWNIWQLRWQQQQQAAQWHKAQAQQQQAWKLLQQQFAADIKPLQVQIDQFSHQLQMLQQALSNRQPTVSNVHLHVAIAMIHVSQWLLSYQQDVPTAIQLLQELQGYLQAINDPALASVRTVLADDLVVLQTHQGLDRMALVKQIQWLVDSVPKLRLQEVAQAAKPSVATVVDETVPAQTGWRYYWQKVWQQLQKVVVVRKYDQVALPSLFLKNRRYADQQLQFLLQQAQWAALQGHVELYRLALQQTTQWLQNYFVPDDLNQQSMQPLIEQLLSQISQPAVLSLQRSREAVIRALSRSDNPSLSKDSSTADTP